jgi:hypothetical protein
MHATCIRSFFHNKNLNFKANREASVSSEPTNVDNPESYNCVNLRNEDRINNNGWLPFLFLFAFSEKSAASPLNPQSISLTGPFFQGWLLRTVDHSKGVSIIFIIGSFSRRKNANVSSNSTSYEHNNSFIHY